MRKYEVKCGTERACEDCPLSDLEPERVIVLAEIAVGTVVLANNLRQPAGPGMMIKSADIFKQEVSVSDGQHMLWAAERITNNNC